MHAIHTILFWASTFSAGPAPDVAASPRLTAADGPPLEGIVQQPILRQKPGDSFSLVILPDTQYYEVIDNPAKGQVWDDPNGYNPYEMQAQWVVGHADDLNVKAVLHMGDLVQDGIAEQFSIADAAHRHMEDAGLPCLVVPGNHDYPHGPGSPCNYFKRDLSEYEEYFGVDRFLGEFPDVYGRRFVPMDDATANTGFRLDAEGVPLLVVGLEFAPRKDAICWADDLIAENADRQVIVVTHCYNAHPEDGDYSNCSEKYCVSGSRGNQLWSEFVARHNNILMVLSGHINDSEHWERTGNDGNTVHEILTDYQFETPEYRIKTDATGKSACDDPDNPGHRSPSSPCYPSKWYCGTGNGWLRTLTFYPDQGEVDVESVNVFEGMDDDHHYFPDGEPVFFCSTYDNDPASIEHRYTIDIDLDWKKGNYVYDDAGSHSFHDRVVNPVADYQQWNAVVARSPAGGFVVAWEDDRNNNDFDEVYARGFDAKGCEAFPEIMVNDESKGQQRQPVIGMDGDGNFVVGWMDDFEDDDVWQVKVRGFYADGSERFSQRTVNDPPDGDQRYPDLDVDADGDFYVVWADDADMNGKWQVKGRSYHSNGTPRIDPMTINAVSDGQQKDPAVAATEDGFVVVWEDDTDNNNVYQVKARGFDVVGNETISQFTVNVDAAGQQWNADIEAAANGDFVVTWADDTDNNDFYQVKARGFDGNGDERIAQFTVNSDDKGQQTDPAIGMNGDGDFFVVWSNDPEDDGLLQVWGRGFYSDGVERRADFNCNDYNDGQQRDAEVALDSGGNFVVVWEDDLNSDGWYQITAAGFNADELPGGRGATSGPWQVIGRPGGPAARP